MASEGDIYTIEKIIRHRVDKKRGKLYYIKWQGWDQSHNTWEPEENILDKELLQKYADSKKRGSKRLSGQPPSKQAKYDSDQESNTANNSAVSIASEAQSEGHFDVEDADKEPVGENVEGSLTIEEEKEPEAEAEKEAEVVPQEVEEEKKSPIPEEVTETSEEQKTEDVPSGENQPETQPQDQQETEQPEKKEEDPIDFYAKEVTETEYQITKPNDPECEVKIQLSGEPCVTLQNEAGESATQSNDVAFDATGDTNSAGLNTTTWFDKDPINASTTEPLQYNTDVTITQVVSDNVPVDFYEC